MRPLVLLALVASGLGGQSPQALFQARRFDEARTAARTQLAANKNDANALYWMGRIARAENKTDEAIDWLEKAVKADDRNALYHYWLGSVVGDEAQNASKLRQPFLARRVKSEFEKAVALDPTMVDAHQGLADFYQMAPGIMGGSDEKARDEVAAIRKLNAYRGHFAGARYAERAKDPAAAMREWEAAIALAPDSAQPYFSLAASFRRQNKFDEALGVYDRLIKAKPDDIVAHLGWGATAVQGNKNLERAERELRLFLAGAVPEEVGNGNLAGAHFRLGQVCERTSRVAEARSEYQAALKINPQHADAKKALDALK